MVKLLQSIPAKYRQLTYFGYALAVFILGAIEVGMKAAEVPENPVWFVVVSAVVQYLGIPVLAVAGVNVTTASGPPPAPDAPAPRRDQLGQMSQRTATLLFLVAAVVLALVLVL